MRSYHPEELFDEKGKVYDWIKEFVPSGNKRMGANPNANGGKILQELNMPDSKSTTTDKIKNKLKIYIRIFLLKTV